MCELDCLLSFAVISSAQGISCRPRFLNAPTSFLDIEGGVHPSIALNFLDKSFVPNDLHLGSQSNPSRLILLSGPNMGGKSTLLRQTCLIVIMAQAGCFAPADSCVLTPIDRIFTRVGANDRIMHGQSTFLVELEETAQILHQASSRSLVILDELGRGTSTFDGTSIAYSVIHHLTKIGCLSLFSTHYHMLLDEFADDPNISMFHMAYELDGEEVVFLYRFVEGVCTNSFGMNVARLAGLPDDVMGRARAMAQAFRAHLHHAHAVDYSSGMGTQLVEVLRSMGKPCRSSTLTWLRQFHSRCIGCSQL